MHQAVELVKHLRIKEFECFLSQCRVLRLEDFTIEEKAILGVGLYQWLLLGVFAS